LKWSSTDIYRCLWIRKVTTHSVLCSVKRPFLSVH